MTPPQSAWQRNWKWIVGLGCFSMIVLAIAFVGALVWAVSSGIKSSDAYREGVDRAATDCEVQARLGTPLSPGWFTSGSINVSGPSGHADLSIPLNGTVSKGTLYVTATKMAGQWHFEVLEVEVAGKSPRIQLMDEDRKKCPDARVH